MMEQKIADGTEHAETPSDPRCVECGESMRDGEAIVYEKEQDAPSVGWFEKPLDDLTDSYMAILDRTWRHQGCLGTDKKGYQLDQETAEWVRAMVEMFSCPHRCEQCR